MQSFSSPTILVVDDNEMNQIIVTRMLQTLKIVQEQNVIVLKALNGQEAVDMILDD